MEGVVLETVVDRMVVVDGGLGVRIVAGDGFFVVVCEHGHTGEGFLVVVLIELVVVGRLVVVLTALWGL